MKPSIEELEERDLVEVALRCAHAAHVTLEEMFSTSRTAPYVQARRAFYQELTDAGWSSVRIGQLVGRHHASILNAIGTIKRSKYRPAPTLELVRRLA